MTIPESNVHEDARIRDSANARAGILAGLLAGTVYLIAQMTFSATVLGGTGWEPLQRIAALLLGPDAAPPPSDVSATIVGMALLIHLPLAALFGRLVGFCVRHAHPRWAALLGVVCGLGLYLVNFWILAPAAFPWFIDSRTPTTAFDHALFGVVAAVAFFILRSGRSLASNIKARSGQP